MRISIKRKLIDRYLNKNSKLEKNTLWFVIYMDRKIPKTRKKCYIICKKKSFNVLLLLGFL